MKLAKLSLAALLAAGLANAASLEEAVKGTEVEGFVYVGEKWSFDDQNMDSGSHAYRLHAAVPVNDVVTAHIGLDNTENSDEVEVEQAAFSYTGIDGVKIVAGEHPIMTEFTDTERGLDGSWDVQNGLGVTAVTNVGGINLAALFGSDNDAKNGDSLQYVHADANVADLFDLSAGYLQVDGGDSYANVAIDSVIAAGDDLDINVGLGFNNKDPESGDASTLLTAYAGATIGGFDIELAYAQTGEDGDGAVNLDGNNGNNSRAENAFYLQDINVDGQADASAFKLTVSADVSENTEVFAGYLMGEVGDGNDNAFTEGKVGANYSWSENFMAQAYVNSYDKEANAGNDHATNLKVELRYDF